MRRRELLMKYLVAYEVEAASPNDALTIAYLAIADDEWGDHILEVRVAPLEDQGEEEAPAGGFSHFGS